MRKITIYLITVSTLLICSYKGIEFNNYPNELIGTWAFTEMLEPNGTHIDTIWEPHGYSIPKDIKITFNKDMTYSRQYNLASNVDKGTWTYDENKNELNFKLYWHKPYDDAAKFIMTLGHSQKDKNGDYYDIITKQVIELTQDRLVLIETANKLFVFKKTIKE